MENIIETHRKMVLRLKKPGGDILKSLTPEACDFTHMGACLMGEAAEIFDALNAKEGDFEKAVKNFIEECGDWEFYFASEVERFGWKRTGLKTKALRSPIQHAVELMRLGGHYWDVVKRHVVYGKSLSVPDKKHNGKSLMQVAYELLEQMEQNMNSIYFLTTINLETVLEGNYTKLADADKGRYGAAGYSDAAAQNRRDEVG